MIVQSASQRGRFFYYFKIFGWLISGGDPSSLGGLR
jgi:hypothetical protein